jgi:predicted nucleic acid-binding protein
MQLVDTNVLVYAYDSSSDKHQQCKQIVAGMLERRGAVAFQNLTEFYFVITTKVRKPLSTSFAERLISDFLASDRWVKLPLTKFFLLEGVRLSRQYGIPVWDALIAAVMRENQIDEIITGDRHFRKSID